MILLLAYYITLIKYFMSGGPYLATLYSVRFQLFPKQAGTLVSFKTILMLILTRFCCIFCPQSSKISSSTLNKIYTKQSKTVKI